MKKKNNFETQEKKRLLSRFVYLLSCWQETLEILADKDLMEQIRQGVKDIKEGNTFSYEEVFKNLTIAPREEENNDENGT